jgi:hypothetical protein
MENTLFAVYDESDMLNFVDRREFIRLTTPSPATIEHHAVVLRAAGYMVIEAGLAKEMMRSHQIVTMLKEKAQARRSAREDSAPTGECSTTA